MVNIISISDKNLKNYNLLNLQNFQNIYVMFESLVEDSNSSNYTTHQLFIQYYLINSVSGLLRSSQWQ